MHFPYKNPNNILLLSTEKKNYKGQEKKKITVFISMLSQSDIISQSGYSYEILQTKDLRYLILWGDPIGR